MSTFITRELAGWGRVPRQTCRVTRPEKRRDLITAALSDQVSDILPRGLGRSYGDTALNGGSGIILTEKLDRFLDFEASSGILVAEAGVSIAQIVETFVPRGWFLPVVPGTKFVTLGGAIACDVHGKNHHRDGCLSEFVDSFNLLLASGEVITCSREENATAFWATIGGLGLTGIITRVRLRLIPIETAYISTSYKRTRNLEETLDEFAKDADVPYSVAWIDGLSTGENLGRSIVIRGRHASLTEWKEAKLKGEPLGYEAPKAKPVPRDLPDFALNPFSVKAFNSLYYAQHGDGSKLENFETFFWPLDSVAGWNKIYGARGMVQYQCLLPMEDAREGLKKILEKISASGHAAFLGVLKVHGEANAAPLSFPLKGYSLALDLPFAPEVVKLCHQLDAITIEHGGRVYLAKDATLEAQNLLPMYPRLGEWEMTKAELDPKNRFSSSMARRLKIGGEA